MRTFRILLAFLALAIPATLFGQLSVSIAIGPPALPVYEQPICPGDGYLWTPGYWSYDASVSDYYWVPGAWVMPPEEGLLWTPGYWGWGDGGYRFNDGYWATTVGFYGGINYGFGYWGGGYDGGRWDQGHFFYNRSANNVDNRNIHNLYDARNEHGNNDSRVSYNGGNGGIDVRANSEQETAGRERHLPPVAVQTQHAQAARANPELRSNVNHGRPPVAANARPDAANDHQIAEPARATEPPKTEGNRGTSERHAAVHPNDLPPIARPAAPNSGSPRVDQKYQQQQDKLVAKQNQERQNLQQKQDSEHQQLVQQKASTARTQQVEQKHQQQTRQLSDKHAAQQQKIKSRQPQPKTQKDRPEKKQ